MDKPNFQLDSFPKNNSLQTTSDFNSQFRRYANPKVEAAAYLEKCLSCILARNFVQSWTQLKIFYYSESVLPTNDPISLIKRRQDQGYTLDAIEKNKYSSKYLKERRQKKLVHSPQKPQFKQAQDQENAYMENPQLAFTRANLLQDIVDKLTRRKKYSYDHEQLQIGMMKKIAQLEKQINSLSEEEQVETKDESLEFISLVSKEIRQIRNQIHQIKLSNEEIMKISANHIETTPSTHPRNVIHPIPSQSKRINYQIKQQPVVSHPISVPIIAQNRNLAMNQNTYIKNKVNFEGVKKLSSPEITDEGNGYRKLVQIPPKLAGNEVVMHEKQKPVQFPQIQRYQPQFQHEDSSSEGSQICWCE